MIRLRLTLAAFALLTISFTSAAHANSLLPEANPAEATPAEATPAEATPAAPNVITDSTETDSLDNALYERARPQFTRRSKVGLSGGFDYLTDSMESWNEVTASFSTRLREGRTLYGYLKQQERFTRTDYEGLLGMYYRLSPRWMLVGEVKGSPTHEVLPIWMAFLQAEYTIGNGFRAGLGARHSVYDADPGTKPVDVFNLMTEYYFSSFRLNYNLYTSNLQDTVGIRFSHLAQLGYYYGGFDDEEVSSINIGFSLGVESAEFVSPNIFGLDIKSIFLHGDHWFAPRWAVTYGVRTNTQKYYSRYGFDLGLDYRL